MILYPWNLQEALGIKDYSLDVYNMDFRHDLFMSTYHAALPR